MTSNAIPDGRQGEAFPRLVRIAEVAFPVPLPKAFHYEVPASLVPRPGARVLAPFGSRRLIGTVLSVFEGAPERPLKPLGAVLEDCPALDAQLLDLALWMARRYGAPIGECVKAIVPSFIKPGLKDVGAQPPLAPERAPSFPLTSGQEAAVGTLLKLLAQRKAATALLYGVPASGKTEVYRRLIRAAVEDGGQALFLVPEISLTQPFFDEFAASLGTPVVLWHSKLGVREKRAAWLGLSSGRVKVVVGARSAALLPLPQLRVAVLDEEQDESFKQEGAGPLYHAREVVRHRSERAGALCVLGSATPSLEAWRLAKRGQAELVRIAERVCALPPPTVTVAAMPKHGQVLSEELLAKLRDRLKKREQAILLVNRRGFATLLVCRKCGWVERCERCGVARIQHEAPQGGFLLRCHHCEKTGSVPRQCGRCGQAAVFAGGVGTQKVVAELKKALPGARVLRMDRDTMSQEGKQETKIYRRFLDGEADILVGTKLVAKSFHFPEVTLVGVVDADTMLNMPDFRSAERTVQLLAQVAGRSGRAHKAGEVLLQTQRPDHAAILGAARGDYGAFADEELAARRELGYPPHGTLVRLVWTGAAEDTVAAVAREAAEVLRARLADAGHEAVGPAPAVIRLASRKFRWHLLLKVPEEAELPRALEAVRALKTPSGVRLKVNVDPYDLF